MGDNSTIVLGEDVASFAKWLELFYNTILRSRYNAGAFLHSKENKIANWFMGASNFIDGHRVTDSCSNLLVLCNEMV